jgi:hypothetical protein
MKEFFLEWLAIMIMGTFLIATIMGMIWLFHHAVIWGWIVLFLLVTAIGAGLVHGDHI